MAINPEDIRLTPAQQERLARIAERSGRPWQKLLSDVMETLPGERGNGPVDQNKSAYDLLNEAGLIGCIEGGPTDVSSNPEHMEGFGDCGNGKDRG